MYNRKKCVAFIIIILLGGIFGYLFGSRRHNPEIWASVGLALGFIIDLLIWYILRRAKSTGNPLSKLPGGIVVILAPVSIVNTSVPDDGGLPTYPSGLRIAK